MAKILHIMLSKGKGGIQQAALNYALVLNKLPHTVSHVFHADSAANNMMALSPASQFDPLAIWQLSRHIQTFKPDLVITHGKRSGMLAFLAMKFAKYQAHHVHVLHRYTFDGLAKYNEVWCVNAEIQSRLPAGLKSKHIPLWLNMLPPTLPFREGLAPTVGFMGRFVPEKGADILVDALREMPASAYNIYARFAGDGEEKPMVQRRVQKFSLQDRVKFLGWVENKTHFYTSIDVLCVPSRWESFGLIVLEAWAYGIPVVALNTDGPRSLINNGENGMLCDAEELSNTLRDVLLDEGKRKSLRQHGLLSVQNYTEAALLPVVEQAVQAALHIHQ